MAIRVANVGADLAPVIFRLGEELGAFGGPLSVDLLDVRDPNVHEGWVAFDQDLAVEERAIELARPVLVGNDQEVGDDEAFTGCRKVIGAHRFLPKCGDTLVAAAQTTATRTPLRSFRRISRIAGQTL